MKRPLLKLLFTLSFISVLSPQSFADTEPTTQTISPTAIKPVIPVPSPAEKRSKSARLWNLQDADILSVINEVSEETGKNFIVDPRVNGKITLISSKPLQAKEVYQVFLSVLSLVGYSAIQNGNVVKIVPIMESGEQGTRVASRIAPGQGDEVVVRVIPLQNVSAAQLMPVIRPLLPQWSNVSAYTPGNVLILLGHAANLNRIYNVIMDVDKAANVGIQMIPLHHASATQLATVLNNLQASARASGEVSNVSIAVDERSNSILLSGSKALRLRMRVLISQLDAPENGSTGNTEVIYLRYLQAKTFGPVLSKIAQNIVGKTDGASSESNQISVNDNITNGKNKAASTLNSTFIQAEVSTNALIITAPPTLMRALKAIITKLDIRPAEVQVEAIIAEIDESNLRSLGIQWGGRGFDRGNIQATSQMGEQPSGFPPIGAGIFGIIPGGVEIRAVLSMLENLNGVDILSTPSIMVLDNQPASIEIGQDVPYQTGSYTTPNSGTASTVQPYNTFQAKPVTLKLDVTPQINLSDSVRLKIKLKNDSLQNPQNPGINPIINTSKINNAVIVRSDDILVIGGLMSNTNNENINKVPILGDLPILGGLFRQKTRHVEKKNLMVFIKPVILRNHEDGLNITQMKYNTTRIAQANFRENLHDIGKTPADTALPPWKNHQPLPLPFELPSP